VPFKVSNHSIMMKSLPVYSRGIYVEVNVQVSRHSWKVMFLGPKRAGGTFQEWRDTSTLTYLESTFTRGSVKDLLDSWYML
jgi:hypothetical protein